MSLFEKAAIFSDLHFGEHQDSEEHNRDCLDYLEWFRNETIENKCDTVIFMGDWFHNRIRTENRTAWFSRQGIEILEDMDVPVWFIVGNHETYLKESRDIHSLQHLGKYHQIKLVNHVTQIEDVVFSPWLVGDEHLGLLQRECRYIFGHFELPFFLMNQVIEKTYDGKGLHIDDFQNCQAVYSGHFHKRQLRVNAHKIPIYYIGNCFGHNFNDANDFDRGMAILEWGQTLPTYLSWPEAPTYRRYQLSELLPLLENPPFGERATLEIIDDMNVSSEDAAAIKGIINARQIKLKRTFALPEVDPNMVADNKKYASLDEMIESKLKSMNYDGKYDPDVLVELYRSV
jgi:hypothetical protein